MNMGKEELWEFNAATFVLRLSADDGILGRTGTHSVRALHGVVDGVADKEFNHSHGSVSNSVERLTSR